LESDVHGLRILAAVMVASDSIACGGGAPAPIDAPGLPHVLAGEARVGRVDVTPDARLLSARQLELLRRHEAAAVLRQSALDWLDAQGRFAPEGELVLEVQISAVRLRSMLAALLLGGAAGADHLDASARVTKDGGELKTFAARVTSSAGGRNWKDPGDRMRRMAQLLGQRVVDAL
jgi:hypothetical protein